jgi:hypothetical protein
MGQRRYTRWAGDFPPGSPADWVAGGHVTCNINVETVTANTAERPYADPEKAARRLMEHARAFEPIQVGRIYIEKINGPLLFGDKATPAEYSAGLMLAIERGWLVIHESGTYVKMTPAGAELFA